MTETLKKNIFSNLLLESILDFEKWSNWKYAIMRICVFSISLLLEVKNLFRKQTWKENAHIYILFFFLKILVNIWKIQKWLFHCIFKKWFDRCRVFFYELFFWKSQRFQSMSKFGWKYARSSNQTVPANHLPYYKV